MVKRLLILILIFSFYSLFSSEINVISIFGQVKYKESSEGSWKELKVGQSLKPGYLIYTGFDSRAILETVNAKIEVKPLSQTTISSLLATEDSVVTDIYLKYGQIKADVESSKDSKTLFNVRSANSTASVRGTIFLFGEDRLFVEDGVVTLTNNYGETIMVRRDEMANSPLFSTITTPHQDRYERYFVHFQPLGLSGSERTLRKLLGSGRGRTIFRAKVVIKIKLTF